MENASKALLIAGSIFLAIVLITFGVYTYQGLHNMANAQDEKKEQEQLVEFNKKYEAYNKSRMRGIDLITIVNMANEDSNKYNCQIEIYIDDTKIEKGSLQSDNAEFKREIYKCILVGYDTNTGRINKMVFEKIEIQEEI